MNVLDILEERGFIEAKTTYGIIGVKVFIFKGEILKIDTV